MAARSSHTMNAQKVYPKDSIDRFGDDLCQHLLSFLSLSDRFRCECVSKQWQRVVYKTQHELIVTEDFVKLRAIEKSFATILKKCQNITKIAIISPYYVINNSNPMLDSIARHCHHLTDICFNFANAIRFQTYDRFFAKFAKHLKSIEWTAIHKDNARDKPIVNNIKCCDNLTQFKGYYYNPYYYTDDYSEKMCLSYVLSGDRNGVLFPKLQTFGFKFTNEDTNSFAVFVENYKNQMKSIDVEIDRRCNEKCIDILMTGLSQMPQLIDLQITCLDHSLHDIRSTQLKQIGINCAKLKRLSLDVNTKSDELFAQILQTINENFQHLKRLEMRFKYCINESEKFVLMSESLNCCKRLTHLTLNLYEITICSQDFVLNIEQNFRKLKYLSIDGYMVTDVILNSLSKLPQIQYFECSANTNTNQTAIDSFINNCHKLISIKLV